MFFKAAIIASFGLFASSASAQNLMHLAGGSEFIGHHWNVFSKRTIISVYASTKPYCPSIFWWSPHVTSTNKLKRSFQKEMTRRMKVAGFGTTEIRHCAENSDYVVRSEQLADHPKNKAYQGFVRPAVMTVRDKSNNTTIEAPALIETETYDDASFNVFNRDFSKFCSFTQNDTESLKMSCAKYGKMSGRSIFEGDRRYTYIAENAKYQVIFITGRPLSYVRKQALTYVD